MSTEAISNVQTDNNNPDPNDLALIRSIFKDDNSRMTEYIKKLLIFLVVYVLTTLPWFDMLVYKVIPSLEKFKYFYIPVKGIIVFILYFLLCNISLAKK